MEQGYAWQGLASVALTVARGNTDADQLDIAVNTLGTALVTELH